MSEKKYAINEIFYSLQGEGVRAGTANVFLRFAGCNLDCNVDEHGFNCDTDFKDKTMLTAQEIFDRCKFLGDGCTSVIFTGGEPTLQLDDELLGLFLKNGWFMSIETNGTRPVRDCIHWITVSPKVPEDQLKQHVASEVKYVIAQGDEPPSNPAIDANFYLISPAFDVDEKHNSQFNEDNLNWCIRYVKEHPKWKMSVQQHKAWGVR